MSREISTNRVQVVESMFDEAFVIGDAIYVMDLIDNLRPINCYDFLWLLAGRGGFALIDPTPMGRNADAAGAKILTRRLA